MKLECDKVSVIVPAYNAQYTIERCVFSLLKQSYRNIEIIVVNDGSSDDTAVLCEKINDQRLKVYNTKNNGVSAARNYGLNMASGKYIMFVDADDYVSEKYCESLVYAMNEQECDLLISGYININSKNQNIIYMPFEFKGEYLNIVQELLKTRFINMPWAKIFKKEYIKVGFNEKRTMGEDFEFNIHYLRNISSIGVLYKSEYYYDTTNENSLTKNKRLIIDTIYRDYKLLQDFSIYIFGELNEANLFFYNRLKSYINRSVYDSDSYKDFKKCMQLLEDNDDIINGIKMINSKLLIDNLIRFCIHNKLNYLLYRLYQLKNKTKKG